MTDCCENSFFLQTGGKEKESKKIYGSSLFVAFKAGKDEGNKELIFMAVMKIFKYISTRYALFKL